jgi:hypothetical protein
MAQQHCSTDRAQRPLTRADLGAALLAACFAGETLALLHFVLWKYQRHLAGERRIVAYVIGVGVLLLAFWGWALARRQIGAALVLTGIVAAGGLGDALAYTVRHGEGRYWAARYPVLPPRPRGWHNGTHLAANLP